MGCCGGKEGVSEQKPASRPVKPPDKHGSVRSGDKGEDRGEKLTTSGSGNELTNGVGRHGSDKFFSSADRKGSGTRSNSRPNIQKFIPIGGNPPAATDPRGPDSPKGDRGSPTRASSGASIKAVVIDDLPPAPEKPMSEHELQMSLGPPTAEEIPKLVVERADE